MIYNIYNLMIYFKFEISHRIIIKQFKETQGIVCILKIDHNNFLLANFQGMLKLYLFTKIWKKKN